MFDFLNKLSHQHAAKQESQHQQLNNSSLHNDSSEFEARKSHEEPIDNKRNGKKGQRQKQKQVSASRVTQVPKRQLSLSAQLQSGQTAELNAEVLLILQRIRDESDKRLSEAELQLVHQEKGKVERKVYLREMSHSNQQYLQQILIQSSSPNKLVRYGLAQVADKVLDGICTDIMYTNKYEITKKASINKDELLLLEKSIKQIKNNEGSIRDKVGELKLQLRNESQKINDHSLEIISKQSYSTHHPKTKEVQQFLKSIQTERMQQRMLYQEKLEKQKQKKARDQYMQEVAKQKALSQRHERLVEVFEIKRKVKQDEVKMSQKKNKEFQQWIKNYKDKVPLFKQKEKQYYENFVIKQKQQKYQKMLRRKQNFLPMQFDELQEHEERYMDFKKDNLIRYSAEVKMQKQAQKRRQKKLDNLYKGQFRYHVLEQMVAKKQAKDPKQEKIQKKLKQMAYSQNVKESYKPKVDQLKRLQMQNVLNSSKKRRKYRDPQRAQSDFNDSSYQRSYSQQKQWDEKDCKKQGERNRRYLKQYLMDKIQKGQIKKIQEQRPVTIQPKPQYLHQMRKLRQQTGIRRAETIDQEIELIKRKQNLGGLLAMVDHHDSKAQRLEQKFKYAPHKPKEEAELEDNYLFSIKAKLELLKNFD